MSVFDTFIDSLASVLFAKPLVATITQEAHRQPHDAVRYPDRRLVEPRAAVPRWFVGVTRLMLSTLREIFDESAYSRFLTRRDLSSCPRAYAAFLREQEGIKARRPKCC